MSEETTKTEVKRPRWKRYWWWVRRLATGFFVFLLSVYLVFQIPAVQTWAAQRLTRILTDALGTRVSIDFVHLAFFDKLVLEGFYLEDHECDTLIFSQRLAADFNANPVAYLRRGLEIEEISLQEAAIHQRRAEGADKNNIQLLLSILFPPDTVQVKEKKPFRMNIRRVWLEDIHYQKEDKVTGSNLSIRVSQGDIRVDSMDLPRKRIAVSSAEFRAPVISIDNYPERPLPTAPEAMTAIAPGKTTDTTRLHLTIDDFHLREGRFQLHNYRKSPVKLTPDDILDYQHMDVFDIDIDILCFALERDIWSGQVPHISLRDRSGFELTELAATEAEVSSTGVKLNGVKIETPYSRLGDQLVLEYDTYQDFTEFPDAVELDVLLNEATFVALRDIMVFAPGLNDNTFFRRNQEEVLEIQGQLRGEINNLSGRNLNIKLADGTSLEGRFNSHNLAIRNEEFLSLRLDRLQTSMSTLRQLIPNFSPPANFDRLERLDFSGRFDGFFADFVAQGDLKTKIGRAEMDMRLNLKEGRARARYSGQLSLENFDLGVWTGNPDFGIVNFSSSVKDGIGLTGETASASLSAEIRSFAFRNYYYENARMNGTINRTFFNGDFQISDDNIDFSFAGQIDFTDTIPVFDFNAQINRLDMRQLNLIEKDYILAGQVDLNLLNSRLSDIRGTALVKNFRFTENKKNTYYLDSLRIWSDVDTTGYRQLELASEALEGKVTGQFDIEQIPQVFIRYFERNYPGFAHRLGLKTKNKELRESNFDYDITLTDSKGFNRLLDPNLSRIRDLNVNGHYDSQRDSIVLNFSTPSLALGKMELVDVYVELDAVQDQGEFLAGVWALDLNQKQRTAPIAVYGLMDRDTVDFIVNYSTNSPSLLSNLNLNGWLYLVDSTNFEIRFDQSNLFILRDLWVIDQDNYIVFGKDFVDTRNFKLTNRERTVTLETAGRKGLKLSLLNFDFSFIDEYWDYDPLDFNGCFNVSAEIGNVFAMTDIKATVMADTFLVNDDDWGSLRLDAEARNLKSKANAFLSITKEATQLIAEGSYNLATMVQQRQQGALPDSLQAQFFDLWLNINSYNLNIAEYFIGDVVSGTTGRFDAGLRVWGLPRQPNIDGNIQVRNGGVTIDFLKTRYTFRQSSIKVNNFLFDASNTVLRDRLGHRAVVKGGISHNHLRDLGFSASLETDRFLALDTQKGDNQLFYGRAIGQGEVSFTGSFQQPEIYISATVGDSTQISIPITADREASELNFISFVQKYKSFQSKSEPVTYELPKGMSLEMDLTITEQAYVKLIFDEQAGDIIEGNGRGNIQILMPREGNFQMFGDYVIEDGEYLFTLYNVVNKDFRIRRGGTIRWEGDPYSAKINIEAEYKDLSTSIGGFIGEYLVNTTPDVRRTASQSTDVDLRMKLQGDLLQPVINFDLDFPELTGELKSYTDSKLRYLRQDPNELNRQVFGLIVLGQFIPSNTQVFQGPDVLYNTVSEFVSNQLSLLITELFSEFIADGQVLSGIDFDIAYNQYQSYDFQREGQVNRGDEFQVQLKQNFFNDRLTILVGGNIDFGGSIEASPETSGAFVGNDLVIEYVLNPDRSLKLRVYQRLQPDIGGGSRFQVGTGLSFRREFDTFGEFLDSFRKDGRKIKAQDQGVGDPQNSILEK